MKKGFTLVEIIAAIIVVGIIVILAVPPILNLVRGTRGELSDATKETIFGAAHVYTSKHSNEYELVNGDRHCITLQQLVDAGELTEPVIDVGTNQEIPLDTLVEAFVENNAFVFSINPDCQPHRAERPHWAGECPPDSNLLRCRIILDNGGEEAIAAKPIPRYTAGACAEEDGVFKTSPNIQGWSDTDAGFFAGSSPSQEGGDSYYFRGTNDGVHNHVRFAGFWWRVIRIEGNGNVRIRFNGRVAAPHLERPPLTGVATRAGQSAYSAIADTAWHTRFTGFMHGPAGCTTYNTCHANTTHNTLSANLTTWYTNNIVNQGTNITSRIATNAIFCGDRNIDAGRSGVESSNTYFTVRRRFEQGRPSLQCLNRASRTRPAVTVPETHDQFSMIGSGVGNQRLTHPVGHINLDEVVLSGFCATNTTNRGSWLNPGIFPVTASDNSAGRSYPMSPSVGALPGSSSSIAIGPGWGLHSTNVGGTHFGMYPVISLNPSVTIVSGGNGTWQNPYVLN